MDDLSGIPFNELRAQFIELGDQLSVLAEKRLAYAEEITRRAKSVAAHAKVDQMSEDEKEALKIVLAGGDVLQSKAEPEKIP